MLMSRVYFCKLSMSASIYTLSLHDALPICTGKFCGRSREARRADVVPGDGCRSEEHTSELQSRFDLVCRLLLEKKTGRRGRSAPRAGCWRRTAVGSVHSPTVCGPGTRGAC